MVTIKQMVDNPPSRQRPVTILGAGPGGLATALLLADTGLPVRIVERRSHVGGRTSALRTDGFTFDVGPTFFLYPEPLAAIFRQIGLDLHAEIPMVRLDPQYRVSFGAGGHLDATPDPAAMEAAITALSPQDAGAFTRFMEQNRRKFDKFAPIFGTPFRGLGDLLSPDMLRALPELHPLRTLGEDLARTFRDPRLQLAFTFQSKYLGMSPFRCPSLFSILSYLEYAYGVWHPIGGCQAVTDTMARLARERGVEIMLDTEVTGLGFDGRKVTELRTNSGRLETGPLVINGDFAHVMRRLVPNRLRPTWNDRRIDKARFSCSTYMLYLGIEGRYDDLPHHTIHIAADYAGNLADIERHHRLSAEPSFYVQNACVTDPTLAPPGMSTLYILVPVPHLHPSIDWRAEEPRMRERILDELANRLGLVDLRSRIRVLRAFTPLDWQEDMAIHLGATFNLSHDLGQMLHLRPQNRFKDLDNVYLVGGGTHPGSGLPVIFESARISGRLLLEDLGLTPGPATTSPSTLATGSPR